MELERVLHPMSDRRVAFALEATQISCRGSWDHCVGLLRLSIFERADSLKCEAAALVADATDDAFDADERRSAVGAVHHCVLDVSFAFDVTSEGFGNTRSRQLRLVRAFAVWLLIPALDRKTRFGGFFHFPSSGVPPKLIT